MKYKEIIQSFLKNKIIGDGDHGEQESSLDE